jgi:FkbM family methyltransferase
MTCGKNHPSKASTLEKFFLDLPALRHKHAPSAESYAVLKQEARKEVEGLFAGEKAEAKEFPPFGELIFPYHKMGSVDSLNLFDLDELIIFSFYWRNRGRYKKVLDIGANLGLHSILLDKCGFEICCFEPDPTHFQILQENLKFNKCAHVQAFNAAVSSNAGEMEFVRVLGNTTGSHLAGSKVNPYGELERFPVEVQAIGPLIEWADLIKLDAEGHEKEILLATQKEHWLKCDALVEVENANNAALLYEHFRKLGVNLFSQKLNWEKIPGVSGMPTSYKEGTLFISLKDTMPWG